MHTAELRAWPRHLTYVEGKVLPGIRWCNRGPLLEPDTDPSPFSGGGGVQKLGQQREHILSSRGMACCKKLLYLCSCPHSLSLSMGRGG